MKNTNIDAHWNVWLWDINHDELEVYDVIPRFIYEFKRLKKKNIPDTIEKLSEWLNSEALHTFWSRCEYEILIYGWPPRKSNEKVDVYDQLQLNWEAFVNYFYENVYLKLTKNKRKA